MMMTAAPAPNHGNRAFGLLPGSTYVAIHAAANARARIISAAITRGACSGARSRPWDELAALLRRCQSALPTLAVGSEYDHGTGQDELRSDGPAPARHQCRGTRQPAQRHEDASEKHVAMENRLWPMRELLAELLLELNQPARALAEFESSLKTSRNRLRGLSGAAQAAELAEHRERRAPTTASSSP
jgi:hypothetical protein